MQEEAVDKEARQKTFLVQTQVMLQAFRQYLQGV